LCCLRCRSTTKGFSCSMLLFIRRLLFRTMLGSREDTDSRPKALSLCFRGLLQTGGFRCCAWPVCSELERSTIICALIGSSGKRCFLASLIFDLFQEVTACSLALFSSFTIYNGPDRCNIYFSIKSLADLIAWRLSCSSRCWSNAYIPILESTEAVKRLSFSILGCTDS
jgi:hypothetical protein